MPLARYFSFVGGVLLALLFILTRASKTRGLGKGESLSARHSYLFRPKWPERIVYDTSLPTIVPTSISASEGIIRAPEKVAEASTDAKERASFAMLTPSGEQLQTSKTKMRELKPRHQVKIVRKRAPTPRFAMARHLQSGWFGFGGNSW